MRDQSLEAGWLKTVLLSSYLSALGLSTLTPTADSNGKILGIIVLSRHLERVLNLLLLMPLAPLVSFTGKIMRVKQLIILGPAISIAIELCQLFIPGRVSDWRDVLLNSSGYLIVCWLILRREEIGERLRRDVR